MPNKIKGPMTSYSCFVRVIREEHKKKHPTETIDFAEFSRKCGEKWKSMNEEERAAFEEMANTDKQRHQREVDAAGGNGTAENGGGGGGGKKRKRGDATSGDQKKDPMKPKRGITAFFFFSDEFRSQVRAQHPEMKVSEVAKELGRMWRGCDDKAKYEKLAAKDKERYAREMEVYMNGGGGGGGGVASAASSSSASATSATIKKKGGGSGDAAAAAAKKARKSQEIEQNDEEDEEDDEEDEEDDDDDDDEEDE